MDINYESLFGALDFKKGDDARSVYSPAAYLADLLQLLDDYFEKPDLNTRRSDIKNIPLDRENTFGLLSYLEIVNELLKKRNGGTSLSSLKDKKYPLNLPFNIDQEKVNQFLEYNKVRLEDIYKLFSLKTNPTEVARTSLRISSELLELTIKSDLQDTHTLYGLENKDQLQSLSEVKTFLQRASINGITLRALLFQDLGTGEEALATQFFINHDLNGYATLDGKEETIIWQDNAPEADVEGDAEMPNPTQGPIPEGWFAKVNRLIRLSKATQISIKNLDLILRTCCENQLNETAIQRIATVQSFAKQYELPIDEVCSFFAPMNVIGHGSDNMPVDYFNRIYNKDAAIDGRYFQVSDVVPGQLSSLDNAKPIIWTADLSGPRNLYARKRIAKALKISEKALQFMIDRLAAPFIQYMDIQLEEPLSNHNALFELSLFHRVAKCAQILDLSVKEYLQIFDMIRGDATIRKMSNFNSLIPIPSGTGEIQTLDIEQILINGALAETFWLMPQVDAIASWLQLTPMSTADLMEVLQAKDTESDAGKAYSAQKIRGLNTIYQQLKPSFLQANFFESERFNQRAARLIFEGMTSDDSEVVVRAAGMGQGSANYPILKQDAHKIKAASEQIIPQFQLISAKDFTGLGIEEKMQHKIFNNLIIKGLIKPDGTIIKDKIPANIDAFSINNSSLTENESLFNVIHELYEHEAGNGNGSGNGNTNLNPEDFVIYQSDLDALAVDETRKVELYDNLIFNGYINEEGAVLNPGFFALTSNKNSFDANAHIATYSPQVYALIQAKFEAYQQDILKLDPSTFTGLGLKEIEVLDLLENLQFNEYLDTEYIVQNKSAIESLDASSFKLALPFYPYRHQILDRIQSTLSAFKTNYYTIAENELNAISQEIVADLVHQHLSTKYLANKRFTKESIDFFSEDNNAAQFQLGKYFDANTQLIVFKAVKKIIEQFYPYQINNDQLIAEGFEEEDASEIISTLQSKGYLRPDGTLDKTQIEFFLNINNALILQVDNFEDFSKDIFFILHDLAKTTAAALKEISDTAMAIAIEQKGILLNTLQELLEMPANWIETIVSQVFPAQESIVEIFTAPVLSVVEDEAVKTLPATPKFNRGYDRIQQFSKLASLLGLDAQETAIIFRDQDIAQKFPEPLHLEDGLDRFDFIIKLSLAPETYEAFKIEKTTEVLLLYSAPDRLCYFYDSHTYALLGSSKQLEKLIPELKTQTVDAAFNDPKGNTWIIAGTEFFYCAKGETTWEKREKSIGQIKSNFVKAENIDASFVDAEGKIYLFAGDQYLRCSDTITQPDPGYPKKIKGNWVNEFNQQLPEAYQSQIDAAFKDRIGNTYLFKGEKFINTEDTAKQLNIAEHWGKVKNNLAKTGKLDATLHLNDKIYFFSDDQVLTWSSGLEYEDGTADLGSIQSISLLIPNLPEAFEDGIDSIFRGFDNKIHIFRKNNYLRCSLDFMIESESTETMTDNWAKIGNRIQESGKVSAAFSGLDGCAYIFSGDQFYRYSGLHFDFVDEGYPKSIASHWGGLEKVDAAFVLDGKTYLFGKNAEDQAIHVRYSSNDYSQHDENYPKDAQDDWWAEHFNLKYSDFNKPDTVFWDDDGSTYLFKSGQYIQYNHLRRWWSEPKDIKKTWKDLKMKVIDAAFTAKNGQTYFFAGKKVYRYTDPNFQQLDDRYPKVIADQWAKIKHNIHDKKQVDATLVLSTSETKKTDWEVTTVNYQLTFLFSGNQYVRYSDGNYDTIDEGYPKRINQSLKEEPGFNNLAHQFPNGIDAAFADQRNIYLFSDGEAHVISTELGRMYTGKLTAPITNLLQEKGKLYVENQEGWQMLRQVESNARPSYVGSPLVKYKVPSIFQSQLNAALHGTDDNLYLFKDGKCYNNHLEKSYPINEEWGKIKNNIVANEQVDAAFVGRDGKTYVFSGDQFFTYTSNGGQPIYSQTIEGLPQSIAKYWGGLNNVQLAFIKAEKTYLFEAPDEDGQFRYICFSGEKYDTPDSEPQKADYTWWGFPSAYLEDGFTQVQAVIFEEDNMYLLSESMFIQFNQSENIWNYPRPIERIWRNYPATHSNGENIGLTSAFKTSNGNTYFFTSKRFFAYQDSTAQFSTWMDIKNAWGRVSNNIEQQNKVDAAVVVDGKTYLFSGDQYVRYSTKDYRMIDENYPKKIIEALRTEQGFENLPEQFESALDNVLMDNGRIGGAAADTRNVYLFVDTNVFVASKSGHGTFDVQRLSRLANNIQSNGKIDASFINNEGQTFLFSGDQYVRYLGTEYDEVDEGYPKPIRHYLQQFNLELPLSAFSRNLDAALQSKDGKVYLFKGKSVFNAEWPQATALFADKLKTDQEAFSLPVDAAFVDAGGGTYFFKGDHYIKYSSFDQTFVDEGYPKTIKSHWGNIPESFTEGIDGAFVFEGRTYLSKGKEHVRYSNTGYHRIDAIYPQSFKYRWTDWNDYLLNDVQLITAFKLLNTQTESDHTISDLLSLEKGYTKAPYQMLADIFDWDIDQVKWIKQHNAFLKASDQMEVNFNIELILQMHAIFDMAERMATTPQALFQNIWWPAFDQNNWGSTANQLKQNLALDHSEKDWQQIEKELKDKINTLEHQALLPYVIAMDDTVDDPRDLFANMLIDVEMGSDAQTSRIKEAIAALQLYVHRFFTNLETGELKETDPEKPGNLNQLKSWWKWMKNYRVWEANRKVFLYPENYIRPELRDTKTPEFKKLEETLLSGNIEQDTVTKAYNEYLNQFAVIGNLKISGANVYPDPENADNQILILFGYTKTDPQQYYYRTAKFLKKGKIMWGNWEKLSINLRSTRVFPVHAFGRILVFWTEIEDYEEANATIVNNKSTSTVNNDDKILKHRADIKYSFYDFNNQWVNPQTLKKDVELDYKIEAAFSEGDNIYAFSGRYCMVSTKDNPEGEVREIKQVFPKLHPHFHEGVDAVAVFDKKKYWFRGNKVALENGAPRFIKDHFRNDDDDIFVHFNDKYPFNIRYRPIPLYHPPQEYHKGVAAAFVQDNTFCLIDQKGGFTFYKKKIAAVLPPIPRISGIHGAHISAIWESVQKAVLSAMEAVALPADAPPIFESDPQKMDLGKDSFWFAFLKVITNQFLKLDPVDAIFRDKNNVLYFLRNGMYDCYLYDRSQTDKSKQLQKIEGFPKPIRGNLSFNMDKFFNKLHVVRSEDDLGEFLFLSYVTPKEGSLLLNGRISADFKFIEGDLSKDFSLYNALKGEQNITARTQDYDHAYFNEANSFLDAIVSNVKDNAQLESLKTLETGITKFSDVIQGIEAVISENEDKSARSRKVAKKDKEKIDTDAEETLAIVADLSNTSQDTNATDIKDAVTSLQNLLSSFAGSTSNANLVKLIEAKNKANDIKNGIDLTQERQTIKDVIVSYYEPSKEIVDQYIHYQSEVYQSYEALIENIDQLINVQNSNQGKSLVNSNTSGVTETVEAYKRIKSNYLSLMSTYKTNLDTHSGDWSASNHIFNDPLTTANLTAAVNTLAKNLSDVQEDFSTLNNNAEALDQKRTTNQVNNLHELYYGKFDLFPAEFHIQNDANFTFSEPDWYIFEAKKGTFLCKPNMEDEQNGTNTETNFEGEWSEEIGPIEPIRKYDIIRLTTTTIPKISNRLFSGGIKKLIHLKTQELDEIPYFKPESQNVVASNAATAARIAAETITYNPDYISSHPEATTLDYRGANKNYYWEMFFHAPFLIAQSLNTAQKFEEAKEWYEYIFDPTSKTATWQFLPLQKGLLSDIEVSKDLQEYITQKIDIDDLEAEIATYLNDPFDPHAIAHLREIAYKKAIVMRYIDNLLDWGDMLFGQYTMESINEARMYYILAYDLLGKKPESLGKKMLGPQKRYRELQHETVKNDLLLEPTVVSVTSGTPNESIVSPYFFIPSNTLFHDYWNRVEDRLFKIRNSLNIDGIKQALPLFQPPIDPMSIVQAVGSGASLAQALGSLNATVPHYRFRFMVQKAKELVAKLNQFSSELIGVLEKKDAEEISLLQNKQEAKIRSMMTSVKEAQLAEAKENINALQASLDLVKANQKYNEDTFKDDFLPLEILQLTTMGISVGAHAAAVILKILAAVTAPIPQMKIGLDVGPEAGGKQISKPFSEASEAVQSAAEGLSILGEMFGIGAQHQRMMADTKHAADTAVFDIAQIESQIKGAEIQIKMAEYELAIHLKELEHQESINTFMQNKFSNKALYQWMSGKLSAMYYQTYKLALDIAKSAEAAYQFERGAPKQKVNFIKGMYWDSQRKGLLAGDQLGLDLERMEQAFMQSDKRRLEITKSISLLELDPRAFLELKSKGVCEFEFSEAFFDYDFPGHYCRQVKTIAISFDSPQSINATLTQLSNKMIMEADKKAVKFLLDPKDAQPSSIRSNWRPAQQIALSHIEEYEQGNGLFELRFDDEKYLPFEGTGAVSRWRLELNGKRNSIQMKDFVNLTIRLRYTALAGGELFKDTVKGLLKPYFTTQYLNLADDFYDAWENWLGNGEPELRLQMTQDRFPNMASSKITGIFSRFESTDESKHSFSLNDDENSVLKNEQFTLPSGLSVSSRGSEWILTHKGDKTKLSNVLLVIGYKAKV